LEIACTRALLNYAPIVNIVPPASTLVELYFALEVSLKQFSCRDKLVEILVFEWKIHRTTESLKSSRDNTEKSTVPMTEPKYEMKSGQTYHMGCIYE
jgi:hypothetical protein